MSFTALALVLGIVGGIAAGGRLANVTRRPLELVWLLALSVALQVVAESLDIHGSAGLAMVLASYVGLAAFAIANIRFVGMPVVLVGLLCNLVVITANGGMPVREDAIVAAGAATRDEIRTLEFGAKRHLEDRTDVVTFLGDIVPVPPTREVLSFGDLILAAGVADVIFRLLKPAEPRTRRERRDRREPARAAGLRAPQLVDA